MTCKKGNVLTKNIFFRNNLNNVLTTFVLHTSIVLRIIQP
jgi:hypothetical protein